MRYVTIVLLAALVIALDQWTKHLALANIDPIEPVVITGFFNLVLVLNYGAAFGIFNDPATTWQMWLFTAATLIAVVVIVCIARSAPPRSRLLFVGLGLITGGALGNWIDRMRLGAVVDFFDLHAAGMHWPAFNVADIAICLGIVFTALMLFTGTPKGKDRI